jgi:hypothetical protein
MVRQLAKIPKIDPKNKEALKIPEFEGVSLFKAVKQNIIRQQAKYKAEFKWSGNISPSAMIRRSTCIERFFQKAPLFLEFPINVLMRTAMGTMMHTAFEDAARHIHDIRFPYPDYSHDPDLWYFQEKCRPEYAVYCKVSGVKGKIDIILKDENGDPVVDDLKFCWMEKAQWVAFCKRAEAKSQAHETQVRIYINRLNAIKAYAHKIKMGRLSYCNLMMKPFSRGSVLEVPVEYSRKDASDTNQLIEALWKGRLAALEGRKVVCENHFCIEHGEALKDYF